MSDTIAFFPKPKSLSLRQIIDIIGGELPASIDLASSVNLNRVFDNSAPLDLAKPNHISFFDNAAYGEQAKRTKAGLCLVGKRLADRLPDTTIALVLADPYRTYAQLLAHLYPDALSPKAIYSSQNTVALSASIDVSASLEQGVTIDPNVVIGAGVEIGRGTVIAANAVIGANVKIGRNCSIGAGTTITHALIGNNVIIHSGVRIGQDGFGFSMGTQGHIKVPQIGRVVIQDDVEIGANTTIDRGANRDTIIGEGTKIDNLVQIAHNVEIGRHCVIVSQVGISGSTVLEDFVVLGGQVGMVGHVRVGMGSQIAASSNVTCDVPVGSRWGGTPAKPVRDWFREMITLKNLAKKSKLSQSDQS